MEKEYKSFQDFINDEVIPRSWNIIKKRIDASELTLVKQRRKIISEILEFADARERHNEEQTDESFEAAVSELADICISACTLIAIQERRFVVACTFKELTEEEWIRLVVNRKIDTLITAVFVYAGTKGINFPQAIKKKIRFNALRKDW